MISQCNFFGGRILRVAKGLMRQDDSGPGIVIIDADEFKSTACLIQTGN